MLFYRFQRNRFLVLIIFRVWFEKPFDVKRRGGGEINDFLSISNLTRVGFHNDTIIKRKSVLTRC